MPGIHTLTVVVIFVAAFSGSLAYWHWTLHGVFSIIQFAVAVFLAVNVWVAVCEIGLYVHNKEIKQVFESHTTKLGVGKLPPVFLFDTISLREIFSLRYWAVGMWATYATLDPSYADSTSFGFCIDVGNGFSTLPTSLYFALEMTAQAIRPKFLGMLGLIVHWQEFYGTVMYFFQYFFNRRFERSPLAHVLGIVVPANAIWMVMPALAMWASARLILDDNYLVFL